MRARSLVVGAASLVVVACTDEGASRAAPVEGTHVLLRVDSAEPYFAYFGAAAGPAGQGYYSFDVGSWHVISLNSNVDMSTGSPQERWLRADLAAHPARCTLAFWHQARFSSGADSGPTPRVAPLWRALYDAGADVVLQAHDHLYERFAPLTPSGRRDADGIRGSGGGEVSLETAVGSRRGGSRRELRAASRS